MYSADGMKKFILFSAVLFLSFCNTRINEEQRRQMFEARKKIEIRQVPEADLLKAGLEMGGKIAQNLNDSLTTGQLAGLASEFGAAIRWFTPASPPAEPLLMDLMHAYVYAAQHGERPPDHIQRIGADTVLYVKPVVDASNEKILLKGIWCISIPAKKIVLEMPEK